MGELIETLEVSDIREILKERLRQKKFVTDKSGVKMIEIVGASFLANEEAILGEVNWDYVEREIRWYESESLNVNDIPGKTPVIWTQVADEDGMINSNYGWCIYSEENWSQYDRVLAELKRQDTSRRAVMIYTRPSMWKDYNLNGRSDFMCTNAVQYLIRDGRLHCVVQMRSNDIWAGYRNDRAWQNHVLHQLATDLDLPVGNIYWQVGSLHLYQSQHFLLDHYSKTGETHISKADYRAKYPDSEYLMT